MQGFLMKRSLQGKSESTRNLEKNSHAFFTPVKQFYVQSFQTFLLSISLLLLVANDEFMLFCNSLFFTVSRFQCR